MKLIEKLHQYQLWPNKIRKKIQQNLDAIEVHNGRADWQGRFTSIAQDLGAINDLLKGDKSEAKLLILAPRFVDALFTDLGFQTHWSAPSSEFKIKAQFQIAYQTDPEWDEKSWASWRFLHLSHIEKIELEGSVWDRYELNLKK